MKKIALFLTLCFLLLGNSVSAKANDEIIPFGTGYADGYATTERIDSIKFGGLTVPNVRLGLKLYRGYYIVDIGGNKSLTFPESGWQGQVSILSENCNTGNLSLYSNTNNVKWRFSTRIESLTSQQTTSYSLTKTEAINLSNKTGIKLKSPTGSELSNETEISKYYGTSSTKTVSVTYQSNFASTYYMTVTVTGLGTHDFLLE